MRQPGRRAPTWEQLWWEGKFHKEMRFGDWRCGNAPACKYPNFAYRDFCKQCNAPKADAKWELPQDPRLARCECEASIKPHYTGNCRACQAPIKRPDGGAAVYDPQGDRPLSAPNRGGNLQGHTAEPIMLWLEAVLNPAGPPKVPGDWPAPPYLDHVVARDKEGLCFKVPFTGSTQVARIWEVDHNALCGKLLGHRRRKWADANPPHSSTSGTWDPRSTHRSGWLSCRCGPTTPSPTYNGTLEDGSTIPGMWDPVDRMPGSQRAATRGRRCPPTWTDGLTSGPLGATAPCAPPGPRTPRKRPPTSGTHPAALARGSKWSGCHTAPGRARPCSGRWSVTWRETDRTRLTPSEVPSGQQRRGPRAPSGGLSSPPPDGTLTSSTSSRTTAHCRSSGSWTSTGPRWSIPSRRKSFPRKVDREPCSLGPTPLPPSGTARLRSSSSTGTVRLLEGRGEEAFGSTLADYIFTGISARASTCGDKAHYKVVDNGLWYLLCQYVR